MSDLALASLAENRPSTGETRGFFTPSNEMVTAMHDSEDKLRLIVWRVSSDNGTPGDPRGVHVIQETKGGLDRTIRAPQFAKAKTSCD